MRYYVWRVIPTTAIPEIVAKLENNNPSIFYVTSIKCVGKQSAVLRRVWKGMSI